jgi:hypothetical protein
MKTVKLDTRWLMAVVLATCFASTNVMGQTTGGLASAPLKQAVELSDADAENVVRRSLQYVALYDTLLNFTFNKKNPFASGGWNKTHYPAGLMDASVRAIPRPNNDTLYVLSLMDLRQDPVVIHYPAFESKFVSLETSAMDHYVNMPLAVSKGDFKKPTSVLYYSAHTEGYKGEPVKGVDKIMELSGDFAIAFLRVMPEAADKAKYKANMAAIKKVTLQTLSELEGKPRKAADKTVFPPYGKAEDTYAKNFLPVMQFVFNHTTHQLRPQQRVGTEGAGGAQTTRRGAGQDVPREPSR